MAAGGRAGLRSVFVASYRKGGQISLRAYALTTTGVRAVTTVHTTEIEGGGRHILPPPGPAGPEAQYSTPPESHNFIIRGANLDHGRYEILC